MPGNGIGGFTRVPGFQGVNHGEVLPHRRNNVRFIEPRLFPPEDPKLKKVHTVSGGNDCIAEKVYQSLVQLPVHVLGLRDQIRTEATFAGGAFEIRRDRLIFYFTYLCWNLTNSSLSNRVSGSRPVIDGARRRPDHSELDADFSTDIK